MSKSIAIIETPKSCKYCPLFRENFRDAIYYCDYGGNSKLIDIPIPDDKRQDWCPLKEVGDADDQT